LTEKELDQILEKAKAAAQEGKGYEELKAKAMKR